MSGKALTHIYLSPHLDDAVLACGGMIHQQVANGSRVIVVTICAGDPPPGPLSEFAQELHQRWFPPASGIPQTPAAITAARRAEDLEALARLGAEGVHFDIPDCIYRRHPLSGRSIYASKSAIFGPLHPFEAALTRRLAEKIAALARRVGRLRVYSPLGIGRHVDHQLTRQAAENAGNIYAYFEDYPYVAQEADVSLAVSFQPSGSRHLQTQPLRPETIHLQEEDVTAKIKAIAAYASQISTFWKDTEDMEREVRLFLQSRGGGRPAERLWRIR